MDLLARYAPRPKPPATFPDGRVRFAVGDIHGRADLLEAMLNLLEARAVDELRPAGEPVIIFLGDYVDRGRESARVLDLLTDGRPHGYELRYLRGNHEQSMLAFLEDPVANRAWLMHGGNETLLSYGIQPPSPLHSRKEDWTRAAEELGAKIPRLHLRFLKDLERYIAIGDYVFAHAGIDPARPVHKQTDRDLYWIRARFLNSRRRMKHRVVHGHTPIDRPYADERRVSVDTGAYASGMLTAARLEGSNVEFISVTEQGPRSLWAPAGETAEF